MKRLLACLCASLFVLSAHVQAAPAAASACESKAIDKNGKPLAGAAKASFIKKCESDNKGADIDKSKDCEAKAVGKNGKPLAGAAKTSFMKKCQAE